MTLLRVLLADDEHLIRAALRMFLHTADDIELIGEAVDGDQAIAMTRDHNPDVVLMDVRMPVKNGIEATAAIVARRPEVRVLMLTSLATDHAVVEALRAGASGYLTKNTKPAEILQAIRDVAAGDSVLSLSLSRALLADIGRPPQVSVAAVRKSTSLTPRELTVVEGIAAGRSNAEIANDLNIAESTVKANIGRIMSKWRVRDRVQVLIRATQLGLVMSYNDADR